MGGIRQEVGDRVVVGAGIGLPVYVRVVVGCVQVRVVRVTKGESGGSCMSSCCAMAVGCAVAGCCTLIGSGLHWGRLLHSGSTSVLHWGRLLHSGSVGVVLVPMHMGDGWVGCVGLEQVCAE